MEAEAKEQQRGEKESLCLPGTLMRSPQPLKGSRGPHRNQETLLQKTWREEVEM